MRLFLDTGALTALSVRADPYHPRAIGFYRSLPPQASLTTSNLVFAETVNLIARRYGQYAAVQFGESFFASRRLSAVHYADESLERMALNVMRRFADKTLSFTDASTIAFVRGQGLDGVFGFDEDFRRCGVALFPN